MVIYASISISIPLVNSIRCFLDLHTDDDCLKKMKIDLMTQLDKRFEFIESEEIFSVATLLDPRYKASVFSSIYCIESAKEKILKLLQNEYDDSHEHFSISTEPQQKKQKLTKETQDNLSFDLWDCMNKLAEENETEKVGSHIQTEEKFDQILDDYLNEPRIGMQESIFNYWGSKKK